MDRNSILLLQHREGILSAYLQQADLQDAAHRSLEWSDTPRKGLEFLWQNEPQSIRQLKAERPDDFRSIKILDSFFSDTLTDRDIRIPIFKRALQGVPVKFLLAHPNGPFGKARAEAIGQSPLFRSFEGIQRLARVCNQVRIQAGNWKSKEKEIDECDKNQWLRVAALLNEVLQELPVEVRFYANSPVGPLYFFSDLLLAGRFWVGSTAANLPWEHIIDTPITNDLFDIMLHEFHAVWDGATTLSDLIGELKPKTAPHVFISCCRADETVVSNLAEGFKAEEVPVFVFYSDVRAGQEWSSELRERLKRCDVLIAVVSEQAAKFSDWIRAEIGAAWVLDKLVVKADVGLKRTVLPGILDVRWAKDIATLDGRNELIRGVLDHFNWRMPR